MKNHHKLFAVLAWISLLIFGLPLDCFSAFAVVSDVQNINISETKNNDADSYSFYAQRETISSLESKAASFTPTTVYLPTAYNYETYLTIPAGNELVSYNAKDETYKWRQKDWKLTISLHGPGVSIIRGLMYDCIIKKEYTISSGITIYEGRRYVNGYGSKLESIILYTTNNLSVELSITSDEISTANQLFSEILPTICVVEPKSTAIVPSVAPTPTATTIPTTPSPTERMCYLPNPNIYETYFSLPAGGELYSSTSDITDYYYSDSECLVGYSVIDTIMQESEIQDIFQNLYTNYSVSTNSHGVTIHKGYRYNNSSHQYTCIISYVSKTFSVSISTVSKSLSTADIFMSEIIATIHVKNIPSATSDPNPTCMPTPTPTVYPTTTPSIISTDEKVYFADGEAYFEHLPSSFVYDSAEDEYLSSDMAFRIFLHSKQSEATLLDWCGINSKEVIAGIQMFHKHSKDSDYYYINTEYRTVNIAFYNDESKDMSIYQREILSEIKLVKFIPADKITLDKKGTITILAGKHANVRALQIPANATTVLHWASSNDRIAGVTDEGVITAYHAGNAVLTAQTNNGKKATIKVKVVDGCIPEKLILSPSKLTIDIGEVVSITAVVQNKYNMAEAEQYTWSIDKKGASVISLSTSIGNNVHLSGLQKGKATLTCTAIRGSVKKTAKITIKVVDTTLPEKVNFPAKTLTIPYTELYNLTATVSNKYNNAQVDYYSWMIDKKGQSVLEIDQTTTSNGTVTLKPIMQGKATITCTAFHGNTKKTAKITIKLVDPDKLISMQFAEGKTLKLRSGEKCTLAILPTPTTAKYSLIWKSSRPDVVAVDTTTGEICAMNKGTATITATSDGGKKASIKITVTSAS